MLRQKRQSVDAFFAGREDFPKLPIKPRVLGQHLCPPGRISAKIPRQHVSSFCVPGIHGPAKLFGIALVFPLIDDGRSQLGIDVGLFEDAHRRISSRKARLSCTGQTRGARRLRHCLGTGTDPFTPCLGGFLALLGSLLAEPIGQLDNDLALLGMHAPQHRVPATFFAIISMTSP